MYNHAEMEENVSKFRFSIDMILENKLNFMLSIILTGIGFFLIGFTYLVYLAGPYGKESAEKALSQGIENTGVINFSDFDYISENGREFRKAAFNSKSIHSIGAIRYAELDSADFAELYEIQCSSNVEGELLYTNSLQMLNVDLEVFDISDVSLEDGVAVQNLEYSDKDIKYLYLGHAYKNISVGTQFVRETEDGEQIVYKVAGIIEKGEKFVSPDLMHRIDYTTIRNDVDTEYAIICLNNDYSRSSPWFFSIDKNYSMNEGMAELEKIADKYGIQIEDYPLQEMFDIVETETAIMQESLLDMLFCLMIVILIVVTTLQIVQIYHRSHQYGILYAIGFSTMDMQWMIILRNAIYFILSACVGIVLLMLSGRKYFITNNQVKNLFFQILFCRVLPFDLILMMFLFLAVSFVPCYIFHKMEAAKLMQGV